MDRSSATGEAVCPTRSPGRRVRGGARAPAFGAGLLVALGLLAAPGAAQLSADFTAEPLSGAVPLAVQFHDTSTGGTTVVWQWTFGDGTTINQKNPLHVYTTPGTYSVKLKVTDLGFHTDSVLKQDLVTVLPPVFTVDFSAAPIAGSNPLLVSFTDETGPTAATGWHWDFGDGYTSAKQHPSHLYTAPGSYTVTLDADVYESAGSSTQADLIVVDAAPLVPSFSASPDGGTVALTVDFTDTSTGPSVTGWAWDFGDGTGSSLQHPQHTYLAPGSYTVTLQVFVYDQVETVVAPAPIVVPPADLQPGFEPSVVAGPAPLTVAFTDTSTGGTLTNWSWNFGDGFASIAQHPEHSFVVPGAYSVGLTVFAGQQSASITQPGLIDVGPYGGLFLESFKAALGQGNFLLPWPLAASGHVAVEGGPDVYTQAEPGLVHVFERDAGGWALEATLTADDGLPGDEFGRSVSIVGERILAGAPGRDESTGCCDGVAYMFERGDDGAWVQQSKLVPSRPLLGSRFGAATALARGRAIIGAPDGPGFPGTSVGHAFVFERQPDGAWKEVAALANGGTLGAGGSFGAAVAIDGDWALVGVPRHDVPLIDAGRVDVYRRDGAGRWQLHQTLTPVAPFPFAEFGSAVALRQGRALVGEPKTTWTVEGSGAVHVFELGPDDTWRETAVLTGVGPHPAVRFGLALALAGDLALIGAPYTQQGGAGYVFQRQSDASWVQLAQLSASDQATGQLAWLGRGAALAQESLLLSGTGFDTLQGHVADAVYAYDPVAPLPGVGLSSLGSLSLRVDTASDGAACFVVDGAPAGAAVLIQLWLRMPGDATWCAAGVGPATTAVVVWADTEGQARLTLASPAGEPSSCWAQALVAHDGTTALSPLVPFGAGSSP